LVFIQIFFLLPFSLFYFKLLIVLLPLSHEWWYLRSSTLPVLLSRCGCWACRRNDDSFGSHRFINSSSLFVGHRSSFFYIYRSIFIFVIRFIIRWQQWLQFSLLLSIFSLSCNSGFFNWFWFVPSNFLHTHAHTGRQEDFSIPKLVCSLSNQNINLRLFRCGIFRSFSTSRESHSQADQHWHTPKVSFWSCKRVFGYSQTLEKIAWIKVTTFVCCRRSKCNVQLKNDDHARLFNIFRRRKHNYNYTHKPLVE